MQNEATAQRFIRRTTHGTAVRGWARLVLRAFAVAMAWCVGMGLLGPGEVWGQAAANNVVFQARVTYRYGSVSVTELLSNPVNIRVRELYRIALQGAGEQFVAPGGQAVFPLHVVNAGNTVDSFALRAAVDGDNFEIHWYYSDSDAGKRAVDPGHQSGEVLVGPISPGTAVPLLVVVSVPSEANRGVQTLEVQGASVNDPSATASIAMPLHVTNTVPYLVLGRAPEYVYAGDTYELWLEFGNRGDDVLTNVSLSLRLPHETDFGQATLGGEYDGVRHAVRWDVGSIAPQETVKAYVQLRADDSVSPHVVLHHLASLEQAGATLLQEAIAIELATRAPTRITLATDPELIRADGVSHSVITADVVDSVGVPVADGTLVSFHSPRGTWRGEGLPCAAPGEGACIMVPTVGGTARAELVADYGDAAEWAAVPVTATARGPYGDVAARVHVYFASGALVGRVLNYATGFPESGVEVRLTRLDVDGWPSDASMVQFTDEFGYYVFAAAEGDYAVVIRRNGVSGASEIELPRLHVDDAPGAITFAPRMILGRIDNGGPGHVELVGRGGEVLASAPADADGNYVLLLDGGETMSGDVSSGLPAVREALLTDVSGSGLSSNEGWIIRARTADGRGAEAFVHEVRPGELIVDVHLSVEPFGRVVDAVTGRPVRGAEVAVLWAGPPWEDEPVALPPLYYRDQPNPVVTDENGTYVIEVEPGYYRLQVKAPGYHTLRTDPFLTQRQRVRLNRELALTPLGIEALRIEKRVTPVYSRPGDLVAFTVIVQNVTDQPLHGVEVMALLPEGLSPVLENAPMQPMLIDESTLAWELDSIAPGEPVLLGYEAIVGELPAGTELVSYVHAWLRGSDGVVASSVTLRVGDWPALHLDVEAPAQAAIGDIVLYRVRLRNTSDDVAVTGAAIETRLPLGFHYLDAINASEPLRNGDVLVWEIGDIEPGGERWLVYRAAVGLDGTRSDGVHMARASGAVTGGHPFATDWNLAQTTIRKELFGAEGRIWGRVVAVDGRHGDGQGGVPLGGITVLLDDGRQAATDDQGVFAFDGVAPGVRSVKILEASLPPGTTVVDVANEPARRGGWSRFVNVRPNSTAWVTVHVTSIPSSPAAEIEHGLFRVESSMAGIGQVPPAPSGERVALAFISPEAGAALHGRLAAVVVEGRLDDDFELWVNGEMVPQSQIGEWLEDPAENLQRRTYYNVPLEVGPNVLRLIGAAERVERTVYAVGPPARAELVSAPAAVPYRDVREVPIELLVTDRYGLPVADGTVVTFTVFGAETVESDLYPEQPGFQLRTQQNGLVRMTLRVHGMPREPMRIRLDGAAGAHVVELPTQFLPEPLLLAGVVDLRLPFRSPASAHWDGSVIYSQGFANGGALTARYDTRKSWHLLPESASSTGMPAGLPAGASDRTPSADPLYFRYESDRGYVLYGDYSPAVGVLSRYTLRRGNVTGLQSAWQAAAGQIGLYAFAHRGEQHVETFPLISVSGVFHLSHVPVAAGTEEVWLVRKDALLDVELGRERLLRERDYELHSESGLLRVKNPFPHSVHMGERLFVEVVYTKPAYHGSGTAFGLQYAAKGRSQAETPFTFTWAAERGKNGRSDVVGVSGEIRSEALGLRLSYDAAADIDSSDVEGASGINVAGTAGDLRLQWQHFAGLRVDVRHEWVAGRFIRPGADEPLKEEIRTIGAARLTLSEFSRAEFTRAIIQNAKEDVVYRDDLRLSQQVSPGLETHLGLRSMGSGAQPFGANREWKAMAGADWWIADRSHLELSHELVLSGGSTAVVEQGQTMVRYAYAWDHGVVTSVQFVSGGMAGRGGWTLAAEASPEAGPNVYGSYQWLEGQRFTGGKSVIGVADEWELVPGLRVKLAAESTGEFNDAGERIWGLSGTWRAEYVLASGLRAGIEQQLSRREGRDQSLLRLWTSGAPVPWVQYGLEATWLSGHVDSAGADPLKRTVEGEVTYRDFLSDRFFGTARYVYKEYEMPGINAAPLGQKSSRIWSVKAGVRFTPDTTLYAQWAQKRSTAPGEHQPSFAVALHQLGFQRQLLDRWGIDLYVRHLRDSGGTSLHGGGIEAVYALTSDLGIGLGYSSLGASDPDLHRLTAWPEGWYLRLRLKF